jgi:gliding motility-associated-like protein
MCAVQTFDVEVAGEVEVYNAVSPEGKNPILRFRFIEILPDTRENKVLIYNRWGDVVFEVDNYNNTSNVFAGASSNGTKLPSGTYYYKVTFSSNRPPMTGFLELRY